MTLLEQIQESIAASVLITNYSVVIDDETITGNLRLLKSDIEYITPQYALVICEHGLDHPETDEYFGFKVLLRREGFVLSELVIKSNEWELFLAHAGKWDLRVLLRKKQ